MLSQFQNEIIKYCLVLIKWRCPNDCLIEIYNDRKIYNKKDLLQQIYDRVIQYWNVKYLQSSRESRYLVTYLKESSTHYKIRIQNSRGSDYIVEEILLKSWKLKDVLVEFKLEINQISSWNQQEESLM